MNPIKNKKNLETAIDEIRNYAYSYLEKYSPSQQQLRIYLYNTYYLLGKKLYKLTTDCFLKILLLYLFQPEPLDVN